MEKIFESINEYEFNREKIFNIIENAKQDIIKNTETFNKAILTDDKKYKFKVHFNELLEYMDNSLKEKVLIQNVNTNNIVEGVRKYSNSL